MSVATLKPPAPPPEGAELVPRFYNPDLIVSPDDNLVTDPSRLTSLLESVREHTQLVPGWVCPSPELPEDMRLCIEGNSRLAVTRLLRIPFWAFDLGRFVPEEERIQLIFHHNHSRRVMTIKEIAERAARYIELTHCTQADAAKRLNVSGPTLSKAFGERRIPAEFKARADRLGFSTRSMIAALPVELMAQAIEFADAPGPDGKKPSRDQLGLFIRQLKKGGTPKNRKARAVTLRQNGRSVTLTVNDKDSALTVAEDLKAIVAKLGKHADVSPDGWPFLFQ